MTFKPQDEESSLATHIQWKGTSICIDVECLVCGEAFHVDGYFSYHIQCPDCSAIHKLDTFVKARVLREDEDHNVHPLHSINSPKE